MEEVDFRGFLILRSGLDELPNSWIGLKCAVVGAGDQTEYYRDAFAARGCAPVLLPFGELNPALEIGIIDFVWFDNSVSLSLFEAVRSPSMEAYQIDVDGEVDDYPSWFNFYGGEDDEFFDIDPSYNWFFWGKGGTDHAIYPTMREQHEVYLQNDGRVVITDPVAGNDTLDSVEIVHFQDGKLIYDLDSPNFLFTYLVYAAGYGRTPDEGGLRFWTGVLDSLDSSDPATNKQTFLANEFLKADEYQTLYGPNPSDFEYVDAMYENVLKRPADQEGYDFWVGGMQQGLGRDDILIAFAISDENVLRTEPDVSDGIWVG